MRLYHGSSKGFTAHIGLCLTDDSAAAWEYAVRSGRPGTLTTVELSTFGLKIAKGRDFGEGSGDACGDTPAEIKRLRRRGVDVVEYMDEAPGGMRHRTWRLLSQKALRAVSMG